MGCGAMMGCGASTGRKADVVPVMRRRLSLGELGPDDGTGTVEDITEEDRGLLTSITQQDVFEFVKANNGRRYSLGSTTDAKGNQMNSFSSKTTKLDGKPFDSTSECIGYACKKGLKPEAPNQDSFLIMKIDSQYALYGVFDGHGRKGHDISNFVKDNLPKILFSQDTFQKDPQDALIKTFTKTQYLIEKATAMKTIDASRSGTTCSVVLHCIEKKCLFVAHVGDSRVVLGKQVHEGQKSQYLNLDLTIDHKPDLPEERARIEQNGGVVVFDGGWNYRVFAKGKKDSRGKRYPGLNMSRAMGDLSGFNDAGISCVPDVSQHLMSVQPTKPAPKDKKEIKNDDEVGRARTPSLQSSTPTVSSYDIDRSDKFILLCSDGVWEFISSKNAVQEVAKFEPEDAEKAAEHLALLAWDSWMREMDGMVVDDITALVIHLNTSK